LFSISSLSLSLVLRGEGRGEGLTPPALRAEGSSIFLFSQNIVTFRPLPKACSAIRYTPTGKASPMPLRFTSVLLVVLAVMPGCASDKGQTRIDWKSAQPPATTKAKEPGDYAL